MPELLDDERVDIEESLVVRIAGLEAALDAERERAEAQVERLQAAIEHIKLWPYPTCMDGQPEELCPFRVAIVASEEEK